MLDFIWGTVTFKINGDFRKILDACKKQDIFVVSIKNDDIFVFLEVNSREKRKIFAILRDLCYNYNIVKSTKLSGVILFCKRRLGIFLGSFAALVVLIFYSTLLTDIKIYGTDSLSQNQILDYLQTKNIKSYMYKKDIDAEVLKQDIIAHFDEVILCSVIVYGNSLIINIKEKIA